jgi:glutathione S-transferase
MKLYFSPGACSLASRIVLEEVGTAFEAEQVDMKARTCTSGDFRQISPRGQVPVLKMDNGEILTEGAVIMQYIADQKPEANLVPKFGTTERYRTIEAVNFVATEIHRTYSNLFHAERLVTDAAARETFKGNVRAELVRKFDFIEGQLNGRDFFCGKTFTIADAYLFTCWSWNQHVGIDGSAWKNINAWSTRVYARPAVQRALKAEGLLK